MADINMMNIEIGKIPAILWGNPSDKVYLYVHGKAGCKEEAEILAQIVCMRGWQVISFDLPEHGQRKSERNSFNPWTAVPEIKAVYQYAKENWSRICLYANSLGAWFSMLGLAEEKLEKCLFVAPVLDMRRLIENMMGWANVTLERLEREQEIATDFGEVLSWEYYVYAKGHLIRIWNCPTEILYAGKDNLVERETVDDFMERFHCGLMVMEDGEHWFHTAEQLEFLHGWIRGKG